MSRGRSLSATVAVVCVLAPAGPARAAQKAIWGPVTLPGGGNAFPLYADLGVDSFQDTLYWSDIAQTQPASPSDPSDPAYAWPAHVDRAVDEAARHGIRVALLVTYSPSWANGGKDKIWGPTSSADFADFMTAASRRYPSVHEWMIWGEPDRVDRFQPNEVGSRAGPEAYARLLDAAYGALKDVSAQNIVIGGMTWTGGDVKPESFLRFMRLPSGMPPRLDWYGHNPFPFRFPDLSKPIVPGGWRDISDLDTLEFEVRRTYAPLRIRPKLWLSEFTVQSDQASSDFELFVSRAEQARWLSAAYEIADSAPSIAGLGWLELTDQRGGAGAAKWGLLEPDGDPKPALEAYRLAPSERLRPGVGQLRRGRGRVVVRVIAKASGRATVALVNRVGRRLRRARRRVRAGRGTPFTLSLRGLVPGRYRVVVRAPRGARVVRRISVR